MEMVIGFSRSGKHALCTVSSMRVFCNRRQISPLVVSSGQIFPQDFDPPPFVVGYFSIFIGVFYFTFFAFRVLKGFGNLPTAVAASAIRVRPGGPGFYVTRARKPKLIALSRPTRDFTSGGIVGRVPCLWPHRQ